MASTEEQLAQEHLGFDELRPGQEEGIRSALGGRDTLVVMPTGSGKSAIYQITAMELSGPTVVISPLIALQRDQVEAIEEHGLADAAQANSMIRESEREEALDDLRHRRIEFLFLAPEQFNNLETLERVKAAKPSLVVVDEAHCVSAWGHDFRPEYLQLGEIVDELGHPTVLALTATAAPPVREEILHHLHMRDALVVVRGFDRPNIHLAVETFADERAKQDALIEAVVATEKPGIVYAATRRRAEEVSLALIERGVLTGFYHAGLRARERNSVQEAFMNDEVEAVVATAAFGMGIDKANVRFVFHYDIADSIDSYYQEFGRAGRDDQTAAAMLFYRPQDVGVRRFFASRSDEKRKQIERSRVDMMRAYAETRDCRREFLLNYFGEPYQAPCNNCDNCESGTVVAGSHADDPFPLNGRVRHRAWGEGLVVRYEGDRMVIVFDEVGYKTLSVAAVRERGLLEAV